MIEELLTRLDKVSGKHPKWMAICPAHEDRSPSLVISETPEGTILIHCFAGCGAGDIMDAIGMSLSDLFSEKTIGMFKKTERSEREEREKRSFIQEVLLNRQLTQARAREIEHDLKIDKLTAEISRLKGDKNVRIKRIPT